MEIDAVRMLKIKVWETTPSYRVLYAAGWRPAYPGIGKGAGQKTERRHSANDLGESPRGVGGERLQMHDMGLQEGWQGQPRGGGLAEAEAELAAGSGCAGKAGMFPPPLPDPLRVLVLGGGEADLLFLRRRAEGFRELKVRFEHAADLENSRQLLLRGEYDLCLLQPWGWEKPWFDLLRGAARNASPGPVLLLSDQQNPVLAAEARAAGAVDCLLLSELSPALLEQAMRYAVERHLLQRCLVRLATYDALSGLPNRRLFQDRLQQALALASRQGKMVGVLVLDLDRFKLINDTLGHGCGDRMLQEVARRLTSYVRRYDTVARMGGDEFVVIFPSLSEGENLGAAAARLLDVLTPPLELDGQEIFPSISVGIALHPFDGGDAETLLTHAHLAMEQAKVAGGNNYRFYSLEMNTQWRQRLTLESRLHRALERGEFLLHYQPQFDLESGRLIGVEALLRWQPPGEEMVFPRHFIPLLEDTGLIAPVGEWVLRTACAQNRLWQQAGLPPVRMSVNLSRRQLQQGDLVARVVEILADTGLDPQFLELELTESTVMQNIQENVEILRRLKDMGVALAIDDFGTGYSSLSCLKHFPLDRLKIDRSFITRIRRDHGDETITRTIILMAHSLKMRVVAEGVERPEQVEFLRANGCDEVQGFLLGRPVGSEEFAARLGQRTTRD